MGTFQYTLVAVLFFSQISLAQSKRLTVAVNQNLEFSEKCTSGKEVSISAVGDVLLHTALQLQAFQNKNTYKSLWPAMIPVFQKFDVSYANFEGPSAEGMTGTGEQKEKGFKYNSEVYTSYPSFNYHPFLVKDLLDSGIDIVSTANNHALDRRSGGADLTIEAMLQNGLHFTGTKPVGATEQQGWHTETQVDGLRIAWLACTFSTNGIPDKKNQVLSCYQNKQEVLNYVHALSRDPRYAGVIVTPHWGVEYDHTPAAQEISFGHQLIDAGALAVLATHPHVIQPWEKYRSAITNQDGLIVYSSGNFVSGQFHKIPTQVGLMVGLQLVLDSSTQHLKIKAAKYLPLMMKRAPYRVEPVLNDEKVAPQFSSIWQNMYNSKNRITDLENIFPNECN